MALATNRAAALQDVMRRCFFSVAALACGKRERRRELVLAIDEAAAEELARRDRVAAASDRPQDRVARLANLDAAAEWICLSFLLAFRSAAVRFVASGTLTLTTRGLALVLVLPALACARELARTVAHEFDKRSRTRRGRKALIVDTQLPCQHTNKCVFAATLCTGERITATVNMMHCQALPEALNLGHGRNVVSGELYKRRLGLQINNCDDRPERVAAEHWPV